MNTNNTNLQNTATLVGRILLAIIFVLSGYGKIAGYDGTLGYMNSAGVPFASVLLPLTILVELGGGLLLVLGFQARLAGLVLFLFLIPVTAIFHNPTVDPSQKIQMLKNISIMGGMLFVFAFGAGAWSLDGRRKS